MRIVEGDHVIWEPIFEQAPCRLTVQTPLFLRFVAISRNSTLLHQGAIALASEACVAWSSMPNMEWCFPSGKSRGKVWIGMGVEVWVVKVEITMSWKLVARH